LPSTGQAKRGNAALSAAAGSENEKTARPKTKEAQAVPIPLRDYQSQNASSIYRFCRRARH
jgi:hypothetical protein